MNGKNDFAFSDRAWLIPHGCPEPWGINWRRARPGRTWRVFHDRGARRWISAGCLRGWCIERDRGRGRHADL